MLKMAKFTTMCLVIILVACPILTKYFASDMLDTVLSGTAGTFLGMAVVLWGIYLTHYNADNQ